MIDFSAAFSVDEIALHKRILLHSGASCPNLSYKAPCFMALPWVKVFVSVLDNDVYKRFSGPARLTFLTALPLAQKLDMEGALATRVGPLTTADVAIYTGLSPRHQQNALDELVAAGFLALENGALRVERFDEFQAPPTSTERVRKARTAKQSETFQSCFENALATFGNFPETETDNTLTSFVSRGLRSGVDCDCRSLAVPERWPPEIAVVVFLAVFANRRSDSSQRRDLARWLGGLRDMQAQGYTWAAICAAFSVSHVDGKHAPFNALGAPWSNLRAAQRGKSPLRLVAERGRFGGEVVNIAAEDRR